MKTMLAKLALFLAAASLITSCGSSSSVNTNSSPTNGTAIAASPTPAVACDDTSITDALTKTYANSPFAADSEFFNFFSKGCEVTLYGGVSSASIRQQAILAAEGTKGVTKVYSDKFYPNTTTTSRPIHGSCACPDGYKACGDICIPNGDQCNIKGLSCETLVESPTPVKAP